MIQKEKTKEIWKDVPGFEGYYQVSNLGVVRSLDRWVTYSNGRRQLYKSIEVGGCLNNGYRLVTLSRDGLKNMSFKISQVVAMAFLRHKPNGHKLVVDHINGDRADDRVENLRIVTSRDNSSVCFKSNRKNFTSKYTGVSWGKRDSMWGARIRYESKIFNLGSFNDELEASRAYQLALVKIKNCTFNPGDYKRTWVSKYKGVSFNKKNNKWIAYVTKKGERKNKYLGSFNTELEAHNASQNELNKI